MYTYQVSVFLNAVKRTSKDAMTTNTERREESSEGVGLSEGHAPLPREVIVSPETALWFRELHFEKLFYQHVHKYRFFKLYQCHLNSD